MRSRTGLRQLGLHRERLLALLLDLLVVGKNLQQPIEVANGADVVALGAVELGAGEIGVALGLRCLRDRAGEILDRVIDVALAPVGLAAPVERVRRVRIDGNRGVGVGQRRIGQPGFDIGPRPSDMGRGQILSQRDRLVVVRDRIAPGVLIGAQITTREEAERVLRLELDRTIEIGAGLIRLAFALLHIAMRDQRRNELRVQLQRSLGIAQGLIELVAADIDPRAARESLGAILRGARGIVDDGRAGRLGLVGRRPVAVLDVAGASRAGKHRPQQHKPQQQLETNTTGRGIGASRTQTHIVASGLTECC
ncbi:hypothetical protein ACVINW_000629 [Bradyrhizobium sp. USDA 4461]